jgi:hypothetical protein
LICLPPGLLFRADFYSKRPTKHILKVADELLGVKQKKFCCR